MTKFRLANNVSFLYYVNKETGLIFNKSTRKEYFLNKKSAKLLRFILSNEFNIHDNQLKKYIDDLKNNQLISDTYTSGIFREIYTNIPLQSVQLELSRKCNLKCSHCYIDDYSTNNDMTLEDVKKVIDSASEMGVINFDITGGEPFLHKNILEILEYIHLKGMRSTIFTNGTIISNKILDTLKNLNIVKLKISIDGYDEVSHDKTRGKGSYKKTLKNIERIKKKQINIEINTVLHKKNFMMVQKIINSLEKIRVPYHIDRYIPMNEKDSLYISDEEYLEAIEQIIDNKLKNLLHIPQEKNHSFFCGAGNSYVFIRSNGNVAFCPTVPKDFYGGNVKQQTLKTVWEDSVFFNRMRNINCKYFNDCPVNYICKGGCRSRSILLYNAINNADLQNCKLMYKLTGIMPPPLLEMANGARIK